MKRDKMQICDDDMPLNWNKELENTVEENT
jgi:hypothetical protein